MDMTVTGGIGTFSYTSTTGCTVVKTLVRLNASESLGMKSMLEGRNMTCSYAKGNFDPRLVTSLVGGMEYCNGDLKDNLAKLIIFT
jgi:ABC-type Zn2+ transport system substrate-binding protein/surface adhesin